MRHHRFEVALSLVTVFALAGCAAGPRARPLPTERIEEGPDSTTAVRKQFEGRWSLVSFKVTGPDGRQTDATGDLSFDGFGVLAIQYRMSDAGLKALAEWE
jgi:hypothetical protein